MCFQEIAHKLVANVWDGNGYVAGIWVGTYPGQRVLLIPCTTGTEHHL